MRQRGSLWETSGALERQFRTVRAKLREGVRKSFSNGLRSEEVDPEQVTTGMITEVKRMNMGSSWDSFLC